MAAEKGACQKRKWSKTGSLSLVIYKTWNISKDWFSSWDIRQYRPICAELQDNFHFLPHFNWKTTEPIFTIFSYDVVQLMELLMHVFARW